MTFSTHGVNETRCLGMALSHQLQPNDVLALLGDMGAGKSEFVRGVARGLGVTGYVTSPTFTILQVYEGGWLPLYHFDWYRLNSVEELYDLSMDEYLQNGGIAAIEWPGRAEEALPETYLSVRLTPVGDEERQILFERVGGFHSLDEAALRHDFEERTTCS